MKPSRQRSAITENAYELAYSEMHIRPASIYTKECQRIPGRVEEEPVRGELDECDSGRKRCF